MAERDSVAERPPSRSSRPASGRDPRSRPSGGRSRRGPAPGRSRGPTRSTRGADLEPEPTIDAQAALKGILIVAVTILVGAFVFVQGLHRPAEELASTTPAADEREAPAGPEDAAPTTAATPPATKAAPADLAIVVGNAVDPDKPVAGSVASKLNTLGYTTVRRMNVDGTTDRSVVHYAAPEWREDALAVARALDIADIDVSPLPNPPPVDSPQSKVFVVVGREPRALSETPSSTASSASTAAPATTAKPAKTTTTR